MTPVEATKTSLGAAARGLGGDARRSARTASPPRFPVKALALPEFTTSARALPFGRSRRHQSTAADGHFERVSTPATTVSFGKAM